MRNKPINDILLIVILMPLELAFALAQDIYIPVVPDLVQILHTNIELLQLTLSLFMLFMGLGQLITGPLSDQHGRKRIVLISTIVFLISSLLLAVSNNVYELIFWRIFQALGASGMMVSAFAIVRDLYESTKLAKMYAYLNGAIALSPLLGPVLGGYLVYWYDWRAPFMALAVLGMIALILLLFFLFETLPKAHRKPMTIHLAKRYINILSNKDFLAYTFCAGVVVSVFFTFFSLSPYILIKHLHVAINHFGYFFGIMGLVFFIGSVLSAQIVERLGINKSMLLGFVLMLIGGLTMVIWVLWFGLSIANFIIPTGISLLGGAFVLGASAGGALQPFGDIAGSASALYGCFEFIIPSIVGSVVMSFATDTTLPFAIMVSFLSLICLVIIFRKTKQGIAMDV